MKTQEHKSNVEYTEELKRLIDELSDVVARSMERGYLASAQLSMGRIVSVSARVPTGKAKSMWGMQ